MEEALLSRLTDAASVAAIVGEAVDWFDRPRATFPAVTLTKVSPGRDWTMTGPDGLDEPRVQFDCWALTKAGAAGLARAVLTEMEQTRDVGTTRFHPASLELERWPAPEDLEGVGPVYRVQIDFMFYHEEITP